MSRQYKLAKICINCYKSYSFFTIILKLISQILPQEGLRFLKRKLAGKSSNFQKQQYLYQFLNRNLNQLETLIFYPIHSINSYLTQQQEGVEKYLSRTFDYNSSKFVLSTPNKQIIYRVCKLFSFASNELQNISTFQLMKYIFNYIILQRLCLTYNKNLLYSQQPQLQCFKQTDLILPSSQSLKRTTSNLSQYTNPLSPIIKERCLHYIKYALASYGASFNKFLTGECYFDFLLQKKNYLEDVLCCEPNILRKQILISSWDVAPGQPAYCILKDELQKSIVITVRGSLGWQDWFTNLDTGNLKLAILNNNNSKPIIYLKQTQDTVENINKAQEMLKGYTNIQTFNKIQSWKKLKNQQNCYSGICHTGIFFAGVRMLNLLIPQVYFYFFLLKKLYLLSCNKSFSFIPNINQFQQDIAWVFNIYFLIIYIQGGGVATVLLLLMKLSKLDFLNSMEVTSYIFGSPSVFSQKFRPLFTDILFNIIHEDDFVPRLSLSSGKNLVIALHKLHEYEKNEHLTRNLLKYQGVVLKPAHSLNLQEKLNITHLLEIYRQIKLQNSQNYQLIPMGNVYAIIQKFEIKKTDFILLEVQEKDLTYFNDIIFTRNMLFSHFPPQYAEILKGQVKNY